MKELYACRIARRAGLTLLLGIAATALGPSAEASSGQQDGAEGGSSNGMGATARPQISTGSVVSKDGTTIAYTQAGSGPVVIIVSPALSPGASGARLAALLAQNFTVFTYDRRGRGQSTDTQPYAVEREVEDIEALIDSAGGSAALFGGSSGAALALEAANRLPDKVRQLAAFEPPFIVDDSRPPVPADFVAKVRELVAGDRRSDAVEYFMVAGVGLPAEVAAKMKEAPMWGAMEKLAHTLEYDGRVMGDTQRGKPLPTDRWTAVRMPTLVLAGERSDAFLQNSAKALADVLPQAQLKTLAGMDHSAMFMAPGQIATVLTEFFQSGASGEPGKAGAATQG